MMIVEKMNSYCNFFVSISCSIYHDWWFTMLKTIFYENDWFSKFIMFIDMFVEISQKWKVTFRLSKVENVQAFEVLEKGHLQCHEFSPYIMWHLNAMQVTPYLTGNLRSNIFYVILDSPKVTKKLKWPLLKLLTQ